MRSGACGLLEILCELQLHGTTCMTKSPSHLEIIAATCSCNPHSISTTRKHSEHSSPGDTKKTNTDKTNNCCSRQAKQPYGQKRIVCVTCAAQLK